MMKERRLHLHTTTCFPWAGTSMSCRKTDDQKPLSRTLVETSCSLFTFTPATLRPSMASHPMSRAGCPVFRARQPLLVYQ